MRDRVFKTGLDVLQISRTMYTILSLPFPPWSCKTCVVCFSFFFRWRFSGVPLSLTSSDSSGDYSHPVISAEFFFSSDRSRIFIGALRDIEWFIDPFRKHLFNWAVQWLLPIVRPSPGWPLFWSDLFGRDSSPFLYFLSRSPPAMKFVVISNACLIYGGSLLVRGKVRRIF